MQPQLGRLMQNQQGSRVSLDTFLTKKLKTALNAEAVQDWDLAEATYRELLTLRPDDHRLLTNLATVFWWADRAEEALPLLQQATEIAPGDWQPQRGLGNVLRDLNRWDEADQHYRRARSIDDSGLSAWNHSQLLQGLERFEESYALSERRLEVEELEVYRAQPTLDRKNVLGGKPLHLWSEQGLGDSLQYLRWLQPLSEREGPLVLEIEPALCSLVESSCAALERPPLVTAKTADPAALGEEAIHGSLLSLPHLLGGAPLSSRRYLRGKRREKKARGIWRVGLCWAAGRKLDDPFTAREYRRRSLAATALEQLTAELQGFGAELFNLQVGPDRAMAEHLSTPWSGTLPPAADFGETAAWIEQELDLVISVDTACAHLCGAIGFPCWVLLPWAADPRWLLHRSDSPWYPSLRLWRQASPRDWSSAIAALVQGFKQLQATATAK